MRKKFLTKVIVALLFFVTLSQAFIIESSYEVAHKKALKSNKTLIVFLTTQDCKHCNDALKKILMDKATSSLIEKNALFSIIHKGQKESYPIEMLFTLEYPTLFFLDKHELFSCDALVSHIDLKKLQKCLISESKR